MIPESGESPGAFLSRTGKDSKSLHLGSKKTVVLQRKNQLMDAGKW